MAVYHAEHDSYPPTLDALKSADLPEIPTDPFSGKSLVYRTTGDGYLLYSVGFNLKDDGGVEGKDTLSTIPKPHPSKGGGPDDIVVRSGQIAAKRP